MSGLAAWRRRHPLLTVAGVLVLGTTGIWAVKLVRIAHSVESYRAYWAEPQGARGGLVYVALGDSAAQSIGASRPERGYVGLLAERMREQTGRPVHVTNLSSSGATIRDLVEEQLPRLLTMTPDVVTVAIGGNDVRSYDAGRFARAVEELTATLPPGTYIADVPYFMHGRWDSNAAAAGRLVAGSARAHQLTVVPLYEAERARGSRAMLTDFAADWFHPNDRGHRVWADAFWQELRRSPVLSPKSSPTG